MLKISKVSRSYGEVKAVSDISLDIEKGDLFGLIGPDGAGKTTLFRIAATLLLPDEGNIILDGHDVVSDYEFVRRNVGYMPGRFSLYQDLSVRENLEFFASVMNVTVEENSYLIEDIYSQLRPFESRRAGALSGGMKQKLALSCALIHKPLLLLLDEPTTGVDAVSRKEFWEMLKSLKKEGITILVSTPYMDESILCDKVALMQDGHILKVNTPQNIVDEFEKEVWKIEGKQLYKLLDAVREANIIAYPFGDSLHAYLKEGENLSALEASHFENFQLKKEVIQPSIEDVFMNLEA
jgi:ABC-2 type transport system ATP-binding protein